MENDVIRIKLKKNLLASHGKMILDFNTNIAIKSITSLFGNSGCGKTSILRMLSGLMNPDEGYIEYNGEVWFDSKNKINLAPQKREIGFLFQDFALFPHMNVEQNICFGQKEKNSALANNLMEIFGLLELRKCKPAFLSGGQKQRVALARALVRQPKLILLDEPLSALDWEMRANLQEEILRIYQIYNLTILLVSHDVNEVMRLADEVIKIKNGIILESGSPKRIF
jgi:molybdate transport system ATP-binding protein